MDELIYEALTTLAVSALVIVLTYLRAKYAKFGDEIIAQMGNLVESSKAVETIFKNDKLHELNVKLEKDYEAVKTAWATGEVSGWGSLMSGVQDFYATYKAAKELGNSLIKK